MTTPRRHTLADHQLGALAGHVHDGDEDHDHDDDPRHELLASDSRALESTPFISIGIDIGSACVQVVFSRLTMRGPGEPASLQRLVRSRQTLWVSPISLTPWRDDAIDETALRDIVDAAFEAAGVHPDDVETGVVVLTGDALSSRNARAILAVLSEETGELVCAAAGHHMEATLAAWGSGAVRRSLERHARILLVDIGGGTTKFVLIEDGRVKDVAAFRVGGRLAVFDEQGRLTRLAEAGAEHARRAGLAWSLDSLVAHEEIAKICAQMADYLILALAEPGASKLADLWLTEPLRFPGRFDGVMFSGGVAEYVYGREGRDFGDLGLGLGHALRARIDAGVLAAPLLPSGERIRATALGAAEHSLQISGETCFISSPGRLLPRRNLQILAPSYSFAGAIDAGALAASIREHRRVFDGMALDREIGFSFRWRGEPEHARLRAFADGLAGGLADLIAAGRPLFIILEGDVALNLAAVLRDECGIQNDMLVLDGVVLRDFDFVDIGRLRLPSNTAPVTVKTLLFGMDQS